MNSMKIITLLLTFLNILTINLNGNYQTKEETFLTNIKDAYEKYTITDCSTLVGTMYVVVGNISGETSLSIFFNNEVSKAYTVRIKRNDKSFVISNYDDYQIYYDIKTKDTDTFVVELITKNGSTPYYVYQVDLSKNADTNGNGLNTFPYHTKLKNKASITLICLFVSVPLVIIETLILVIVLRKKNKNKISNSTNQTIYNNIAYTIEDNNEKEWFFKIK